MGLGLGLGRDGIQRMIHVYPMTSPSGLRRRLQRAELNTATRLAANVWIVLVHVKVHIDASASGGDYGVSKLESCNLGIVVSMSRGLDRRGCQMWRGEFQKSLHLLVRQDARP